MAGEFLALRRYTVMHTTTNGQQGGGHDRRSRGQPFSFLVRLCHETGGVLLTQGEVDGRRGAQEALTAGRPETSRAW